MLQVPRFSAEEMAGYLAHQARAGALPDATAPGVDQLQVRRLRLPRQCHCCLQLVWRLHLHLSWMQQPCSLHSAVHVGDAVQGAARGHRMSLCWQPAIRSSTAVSKDSVTSDRNVLSVLADHRVPPHGGQCARDAEIRRRAVVLAAVQADSHP